MKRREINCQYQPYINQPPVASEDLRGKATSNDDRTVEFWNDIWVNNYRVNHEKSGGFFRSSLAQIYGIFRHRPVIIAGAGPSLKYNVDKLKNRGGVPLVSCLHNFHYFEDNDVPVDYYVTLDAGPITIKEVSEGGSKTEEEYWKITENRTLIAFVGTDPKLIENWRGKVLWYNCPIPSKKFMEAIDAIENYHAFVSTGGNVLGACLYLAKVFMGAPTIAFVGADFCFGYDNKFHSWDSSYDANVGHCISTVDVFGNRVQTWQSYANFKSWFDWVTLNVPGIYYNCTEGGTLGAYREGNLRSINIMDLADFLEMVNMCDQVKRQAIHPEWQGDLRSGMEPERNPDLRGYNYVLF
jgi:hypothetical protein